MPSNMIKYVGLDKLSIDEKQTLKRIIEKESVKITRLSDPVDMTVNVKVHTSAGVRKRYLIQLKAVLTDKMVIAQASEKSVKNSGDWDITTASRKAIEKLTAEMSHKLRSEESRRKRRGMKALV